MKLGRFPRAAVLLSVSLLSTTAGAQDEPAGAGQPLNIPSDVQFVGPQIPTSAPRRRS
jgi:hypothetical protein